MQALLAQPGISWRGGVQVTRLDRDATGPWQVFDDREQLIVRADLVVLAAAHASGLLVDGGLPLQAIRGQVSWGLRRTGDNSAFPAFPVNGHGSLLPAVPVDDGVAWMAGAGFQRDRNDSRPDPADQQANLERLQTLLPHAAQQLAADFQDGTPRAWAGVRCASPDRLPLVGPLQPVRQPGLWVNTAMGSRGLTFAVLGGELRGKTVAVLGVTFKPNTDDMRDAPSLDILPALQAMGARVQAYDPEGAKEAAHMLPGVDFKAGAYEAAEGADALVILTEWDQFRALDLDRLKLLMAAPVVVDLRNVYKPSEMVRHGFTYASIGRG